MNCEMGFCAKFKRQMRIVTGSKLGKVSQITLQPYEYMDIDLKTGRFFVKNIFTDSKMKLVDASSEVHFMDEKRIPQFLDLVKRSEGAVVLKK